MSDNNYQINLNGGFGFTGSSTTSGVNIGNGGAGEGKEGNTSGESQNSHAGNTPSADNNNDSKKPDIIIKSSTNQFIINYLWLIFLAIVSCALYAFDDMWVRIAESVLLVGIIGYLLYKYVELKSFTWTIGAETIKVSKVIFSTHTNYVELYRVIDYIEHQSFIQRLFGLKTIVIKSDDKTLPRIELLGIHNDTDIIKELRARVEHCKTVKRVLEINNHDSDI